MAEKVKGLQQEIKSKSADDGQRSNLEEKINGLNIEIESMRVSYEEQLKSLQTDIDEKMVDIQDLNDIIETKDRDLA
jgi:hypothetical protein